MPWLRAPHLAGPSARQRRPGNDRQPTLSVAIEWRRAAQRLRVPSPLLSSTSDDRPGPGIVPDRAANRGTGR